MRKKEERGFALLIVLWSMVLLAFLMTQILASGRTALQLAANLRAEVQDRALADGAVNEAVFNLIAKGSAHWQPGGSYIIQTSTAPVKVDLQSLNGKVNPNTASEPLLAALLQNTGVAPGQAGSLANAIVAWRSPLNSADATAALLNTYRRAGLAFGPPGQAFSDISELNGVIGMRPAIMAQLAPHLSLFQPGQPDPAFADPVVAKAIAAADAQTTANGFINVPASNPLVLAIIACPIRAGAKFCRKAVVSFARANGVMPFTWLAWESH